MTTVSRLLPDPIGQKTCWRCGADFRCGAQSGKKNCWCDDLPAIRPSADSDCFCPICLNEEIALQRAGRVGSAAVAPEAKNEANGEASLVEGEDYYREGPAIVFTAAYHLRRGTCCGSGCRHCPYKA